MVERDSGKRDTRPCMLMAFHKCPGRFAKVHTEPRRAPLRNLPGKDVGLRLRYCFRQSPDRRLRPVQDSRRQGQSHRVAARKYSSTSESQDSSHVHSPRRISCLVRTKEAKPQPEVIARFVKAIPFDMDLVRGDGGQVVVPPSKLKDVGSYWFMDDSKIRRGQKLGIRVI